MLPSITVLLCSATKYRGHLKDFVLHLLIDLMTIRHCTGRCLPRLFCDQSPRFTVACQLPSRLCKAVQPRFGRHATISHLLSNVIDFTWSALQKTTATPFKTHVSIACPVPPPTDSDRLPFKATRRLSLSHVQRIDISLPVVGVAFLAFNILPNVTYILTKQSDAVVQKSRRFRRLGAVQR